MAFSDINLYRNSSALPVNAAGDSLTSSSRIETASNNAPRKHSLMLPNGSAIIDSSKGTGNSSGTAVVGGMDNYKRY